MTLSQTATPTKITIAHGDGIGPEIMDATMRILEAGGSQIDPVEIVAGQKAYEEGHTAGISPEGMASIVDTGVFLKGPLFTPQGKGFKSVNVTVRKTLGLHANVRPVASLTPFVPSHFPDMDLVVIRENEEDTYGGIEHRQTTDVTQCLKLITVPGTEKIVRYAFEFAQAAGHDHVTNMVKDNIMKITDGTFQRIFEEIAAEYPGIKSDKLIIDIGMAKLASDPGRFGVIVMPNLYGDIGSDVAAEICGSVGMVPSANIGEHVAMFEAIHGTAPDIEGKGVANPSAVLRASVMMLNHIGQQEAARRIHNAWLCTIEQGIHTGDIANDTTKKTVGSKEFAEAVIGNLGCDPVELIRSTPFAIAAPPYQRKPSTESKTFDGYDVFLQAPPENPDALAKTLQSTLQNIAGNGATLEMITNRGVTVWPNGNPNTSLVDHWRCRVRAGEHTSQADMLGIIAKLAERGYDVIKTEGLFSFDGNPGYSVGQGQGAPAP